jgi:hypothetical protein
MATLATTIVIPTIQDFAFMGFFLFDQLKIAALVLELTY